MGTLMNVMLDWKVDTFLTNLGNKLGTWGSLILVVLGGAMLIAAAFFIAKGLMSQGRGQTNWALVFILLIVGGIFFGAGATGGWDFLKNVSGGLSDTANELGN